ncbi:hypothetical protein PR048_003395 [Dryococelus australis]|uniref:Uncharacterized protein n=1 Tax=Dryococelus australis TaxID=614101 RepID=A0ABQ9IMX2_9NEOP|nr:hypothetical protein PR048_003395 [Dryococelus australis]
MQPILKTAIRASRGSKQPGGEGTELERVHVEAPEGYRHACYLPALRDLLGFVHQEVAFQGCQAARLCGGASAVVSVQKLHTVHAWGRGGVVVEPPTRHPPRRNGLDSQRDHSRIFACGNRAGRCRWAVGFLGDLLFPPPLHSCALLCTHLISPTSSLKVSIPRATQTFRLHSKHAKSTQRCECSHSGRAAVEHTVDISVAIKDSPAFLEPTCSSSGWQHCAWPLQTTSEQWRLDGVRCWLGWSRVLEGEARSPTSAFSGEGRIISPFSTLPYSPSSSPTVRPSREFRTFIRWIYSPRLRLTNEGPIRATVLRAPSAPSPLRARLSTVVLRVTMGLCLCWSAVKWCLCCAWRFESTLQLSSKVSVLIVDRGRCGLAVSLLASHQGERVQSPAGSLRIFSSGNRAGRCRWSGGFSRGSPVSHRPSFRRCSVPILITGRKLNSFVGKRVLQALCKAVKCQRRNGLAVPLMCAFPVPDWLREVLVTGACCLIDCYVLRDFPVSAGPLAGITCTLATCNLVRDSDLYHDDVGSAPGGASPALPLKSVFSRGSPVYPTFGIPSPLHPRALFHIILQG